MFRKENGERHIDGDIPNPDNKTEFQSTAVTSHTAADVVIATAKKTASFMNHQNSNTTESFSQQQQQQKYNDDHDGNDDDEMNKSTTGRPPQPPPERELRRPYEVQTPTKYRKPLVVPTTTTNGTTTISSSGSSGSISKSYSTTIPSTTVTTTTFPRSVSQPVPLPSQQQQHHQQQQASTRLIPVVIQSVSSSRPIDDNVEHQNSKTVATKFQTTPQPPTESQQQQRTIQQRRSTKQQQQQQNYQHAHDFQRTTDIPSVQVRYVNMTQRSAFLHYSLTPIIQELQTKLQQRQQRCHPNRISPSLHHLQILHRIYNTHVVRQLQFSPSTSIDADYHYQIQQQQHQQQQQISNEGANGSSRRLSSIQRDGRYRRIDPTKLHNMFRHINISNQQADDTNVFPFPPQFSHRKYRLPNRADVGFSRCTEEEITIKQNEIRNETMWEESQLRIVTVVTCIDMIRMANDDDDDEDVDTIVSRYIPYAGRHLRSVLTRKRPTPIPNNKTKNGPTTTSSTIETIDRCDDHLEIVPNPYSILAPPIESIYSPSQGWRPRIFHDRPTGLQYCYVSPMNVTVWTQSPPPLAAKNKYHSPSDGNNNTMIGSLALYTLPPLSKRFINGSVSGRSISAASAAMYHCQKHKSISAFGKISEEFYFPINTVGTTTSNHTDVDRKAIFSYNPMDLVMESTTKNSYANRPDSLYLVLRVYEVIPGSKCKELSEDNIQLMKHVAFGTAKVYSKTEMQWPNGQVKALQLYSYPVQSETQGSFVERLWRIVHQKSLVTRSKDNTESTTSILRDDISSNGISVDDSVTTTSMSKRNFGDRLFRTTPPRNINHSRSKSVNAIDISIIKNHHESLGTPICGTAQLFLSALNIDFLQCMLRTSSSHSAAFITSQSPQQLNDVTGDFAVTTNPSFQETGDDTVESMINKRSNLLRLPQNVDRAGYSGSNGCHEILYLPARPDKQYHIDSHMALSRSILNFLYIYPRLIRSSSSRKGQLTMSGSLFTIRIQVSRTDGATTGNVQTPIPCFYNHVTWDGISLAPAAYTKTVGSTDCNDAEHGLPIQDEIRVRLPEVLDGHYNVIFTLYSVSAANNDLHKLSILATASIPLTSTRFKDTTSNVRVATIVPNGKHRLEIGEYQLHFETRLVSSIHTSDSAVAATLKKSSSGNGQTSDCEAPMSRSYSSSSVPVPSISDLSTTASTSAVASFFQVLLYDNLSRLVDSSTGTLSDTVHSLCNFFLVLTELKSFLLSKPCMDNQSFGQFVKSYLDLFDESCLYDLAPSTPTDEAENNIVEANEPAILESRGIDDDGFEVDFTETEIKKSRHAEGSQRRFNSRRRIPQLEATITSGGVPFSRVPFDASRIDRMGTETEIRSWRGHVAQMYDDDETIATAPSIFSTRYSVDTQTIMSVPTIQENFNSDASAALLHSFDENSIMRNEPLSTQRSIGDTEFVKRIRSAAAIIIAPCVTPSLTSVLKSPQRVAGAMRSSLDHEGKDVESNLFARTARCLCLPGSDIDEDIRENGRVEYSKNSREPKAIKSIRERFDSAKQSLSIMTNGLDKESNGLVPTVYEMIIKMILRTYSDLHEIEKSQSNRSDESTAKDGNKGLGLIKNLADHMDFIVPLCLRSICLRYCSNCSRPVKKVFIDKGELTLIESFIGFLARCLMFQCMESRPGVNERESALQRTLQSSQIIVDFMIGLTSFVQAKQVEVLLHQYFETLRDDESTSLRAVSQNENAQCSENLFHRIRSSQQLRLLAAENLSSLPSFLALNVPMKYAVTMTSEVRNEATKWLSHYVGSIQGTLLPHGESQSDKTVSSGWLADLVMKECLCICSTAYQLIVEESTELIAVSANLKNKNSIKKYHISPLDKLHLEALHITASHAITIVYELVVRRHSMDQRFQSQSAQGRIAGLLTSTMLAQSCDNVQWLAKLDSTNQVRSTWLLCFLFVIQDAPEGLIYDFIRARCIDDGKQVHEFIGLLNLCSSTFQHFLCMNSVESISAEGHQMLPAWLLQESFNSICAAAIVVVDVCVESFSHSPTEKTKAIQGVVELLLIIITVPQSPVTQLRTVGALLLILEGDVALFVEVVDADLEHWIRILLSLMNCQSLSVRSIAVDFAISLLSGIFVSLGSIDSVTMMAGSILPEVIAREIALYCVAGNISTMDDVATSVWPIRRAIADIGDANPLDDDRVDPILATVLSTFARACQAIIDGVLVELRLRGDSLHVVGVKVKIEPYSKIAFDADEESLFEAASFFRPDMAPLQRIRWLLTLKTVHDSRRNWLEASECLFLCAKTICFSLPFLKNAWRPSRFELWSNDELSAWISTVGVEIGHPARNNVEVMAFALQFLEPIGVSEIQNFTIIGMCALLVRFTAEAIEFSSKEVGCEPFFHGRLQSVLTNLKDAVKEFENQPLTPKVSSRMRKAEDEAAIQAVSTFISEKMQEMAIHVNGRSITRNAGRYVVMRVHGKKPTRFEESTTIPTFLEWDKWCVCHTSSQRCDVKHDDSAMMSVEEFAKPYVESLRDFEANVILRTNMDNVVAELDHCRTYLDVFPVEIQQNQDSSLNSGKHFIYRNATASTTFKKAIVANEFPCALSRQRSLLPVEVGT